MLKIKMLGILFLLSGISLAAQGVPIYLRVDYPKMVAGDDFRLSTVVRVLAEDVDSMEIRISFSKAVDIDSAVFRNSVKSVPLTLRLNEIDAEAGSEYMIPLSDGGFELQDPFQISYSVTSSTSRDLNFGINLRLFEGGRLIGEYGDDELSPYLEAYPGRIKFYNRKSIAGKAAEFKKDSRLKIDLNGAGPSRYLMQFWFKSDGRTDKFLSVSSFSENIIEFFKDKFDYLHVHGDKQDYELPHPVYLGNRNWNSCAILIDKSDNEIEFYINRERIFGDFFGQLAGSSDLQIVFENPTGDGKIWLDMLRIWDYNGSLEQILNGDHFKNFSSDSSYILSYIDFDNEHILKKLNSNDKIGIDYSGIKFIRSDAPIFSRAPVVNISISSDIFSLEWEPADQENAEFFEIEKSTDGREFKTVQTLAANREREQYVFNDYRDPETELVFYRVRQINRDGSEVLSGITKVGQGNLEDFSSLQNYPNPFNPMTTLSLDVLRGGEFEIIIYDIVGNKIINLHSGHLNEGIHTFVFDGSNLPSGIYFYEVKSEFSSRVQKMILAK